MLDLPALQYFVSAYEAGSFTKAAQALRVSQPSVSVSVSKLEAKIGSPLFERSRKGLTPTARGEALFLQAAPLLSQFDQLDKQIARKAPQVLRVYCQPDVFIGRFSRGLTGYLHRNPNTNLQFSDTLEAADIGFMSRDCVPQGFDFSELFEDHYGVALPIAHALAGSSSLTLDQLDGAAVIARPYCPRADLFVQSGMAATMASAVNDHQLLDLVAAGLGIAIVPGSHQTAHKGIVVIPITDRQITRCVGIAARKSAFAADAAKDLVASLAD